MKTKNFLVAPLSSWVARGTCALIATIAMQGIAVAQPFVTLAPFEQGVLDGNPPFALTDDCTTAGDDCGNQDGRIRTNDTLEFSWSVTVGGLALDENSDVTTTSIDAVMFEQTLSPLGDAVFEVMTIPAPCLSPPAGTGGTNPASRIIENTDGSIQLLCNLGSAGNGEQRSFSVAVRPLIQSANLSAITSIQSVYGLDQQGNRITAEYVVDDAAAYEISAAPAYDLIADRSPLSLDGVAIHDIGNGPQPGFIALFTAHIAADPDHGLLGLAELNESVSFRPDVSFTSPQDQLLEDTNWSLLGCRSNEYQWDNSVFGDSAYAQELLQQGSAASNSGNCTITGDRSNGYQVSVDGIDSAGAHYPTATIGGESLLSGPFFVSALSLEIFIPFDEIDKAGSVAGDSAGAVTVQACLSEFAPATAVQLVPDQLSSEIQSNNCTNTTTAELDPDGEFSVRNVSHENDAATLTSYLPLISAYHAGDGLLEPEQSFGNMVFYKNTGSAALTDFSTCSVFDNSVLSLTDRAAIGATPGTFAYTGIYTFADSLNAASSDTAQWVVEYGTAEFNGDDPLSDSVSSQTSRDQASGRFSGSWNKLSKLRCDSPAFSWHTDPLLAGIDNINAVRLVPANNESQAVNPDNGTLAIGQEVRLITPLTARDHFNGGPHTGQVIPNGTIAAVFGSWRSTQRHPQWRDNTYDPVTGGGRADGDRMTITRLKLDHDTSTALPIAAPGVETTALAGNPLVWQIQPLLSSSFGAQTAEDVSLFVTLSAGTQYDAGCTLASEFGRAPSLIQASADNAALTELVFNLGDMQVDSTLEPLQICVDTAASAEDAANPGEATQINAYLRADNAVTSAIKTQSVYLDEGGALFATVDAEKSVLLPDEAIKLTLQLRNMRTTTILEKPTLIFVLPFSGDGSGNAARQPASELEGQLQLTHNPELNYRSFAPIEQAGRQLRYTKDSATTLSHNATTDTASWCYFGGNGFYSLEGSNITCPTTWSEVTALRFDATQDLGLRGERTDGIRIDLSLSGPDLKGGDSLNNVFGVSSNSFTQEQLLIARPALLSVIAFSINGSVFASFNGDYDFDQGIDVGVPDGVPVSLIDVDNGTVLQTVLTTDGRYEFPQLNAGRYRVGLAESVFSPNGLLPRWAPLPAPENQPGKLTSSSPEDPFQGVFSRIIELNSQLPDSQPTPHPIVDLALIPTDADADGIPDIDEFGPGRFIVDAVDTDGDGTPDYIDTDSDGDGIEDSIEGHADTDGDGLPNHIDEDSDGDGIADSIEGNNDNDQDGLPDYIDGLDSSDADGDTIPDAIEGLDTGIDSDNDGLPDGLDLDSDNDGIADLIEQTTDTDRDGLPNYIDTDSDADGIDDSIEGLTDSNDNQVPDYLENLTDIDTDGDGIADVLEGAGDSDMDGIPNISDLDSDADGIPDSVETVVDSDADGTPNYLDRDSDNDGLSDRIEGANNRDSDALPDYRDLDSDNDSRSDLIESAGTDNNQDGKLDNFIDNNRDGEHDPLAASPRQPTDTDFDSVFDFVDNDSDNDGITDLIESRGADSDQNRDGEPEQFIDTNGDGLNEHSSSTRQIPIDVDADGLPNPQDGDSDGDGRSDVTESGSINIDGDFIIDPMTDRDQDSIQDSVDADYTKGRDSDADGIDDSADSDFSLEPDTDGDGIIDSLDPDADGNGYIDGTFADPEPISEYPDFDNNGTPDFQQPLTGFVTSGVGGEGVGCVLRSSDSKDPGFLLMLFVAFLMLLRRRGSTNYS